VLDSVVTRNDFRIFPWAEAHNRAWRAAPFYIQAKAKYGLEGSSHNSSWSTMTEEMVGGQHRNHEAPQN